MNRKAYTRNMKIPFYIHNTTEVEAVAEVKKNERIILELLK